MFAKYERHDQLFELLESISSNGGFINGVEPDFEDDVKDIILVTNMLICIFIFLTDKKQFTVCIIF